MEISKELASIIKKFLTYSFVEIDFEWKNLTSAEQNLCTKEQFEELIGWLDNVS